MFAHCEPKAVPLCQNPRTTRTTCLHDSQLLRRRLLQLPGSQRSRQLGHAGFARVVSIRDSRKRGAVVVCAQFGPVLRPRHPEPQPRSRLSTVPFHQAAACTSTPRSACIPNACSSGSVSCRSAWAWCFGCRKEDTPRRRPDQGLPQLPVVSWCCSTVVFPMLRLLLSSNEMFIKREIRK